MQTVKARAISDFADYRELGKYDVPCPLCGGNMQYQAVTCMTCWSTAKTEWGWGNPVPMWVHRLLAGIRDGDLDAMVIRPGELGRRRV